MKREDPRFGYGTAKPQTDVYVDPKAGPRARGKRGRSLLPVLVAGSAVILFAGFMWISYTRHPHLRPGEVPIISADTGPIKTKPDDPGGMDIPFKDTTVYEELGGSKTHRTSTATEHLLQPPEQPLPKPEAPSAPVPAAPPKAADAAPAPNADILPLPPAEPGAESAPAASDPDAAALAPLEAPQTDASTAAPAPPPASPPDAGTLLPPPPPSKPPHAEKPLSATVAVTPAAKPSPAASTSGNYAVQLGAFKDEAMATAEWQRLKAAHPEVLGSLSPLVERADLGAKGIWYRLKAGPLPQDTAKKTCVTLKSANVTCIPATR